MPYPRGYALFREAQAGLAAHVDRGRIASAVQESHAIAVGLGAAPLQQAVEEVAARAGVRVGPDAVGARGETGSPVTAQAPRGRYDLTPRELEVLELLVAGRSDGEIASTLFISKKTVSVHLNNIKGKLGAESRVQVVTTALGRGLVAAR
jgi:DNA-binding NarL/FixJ family response regulator